MTIDAIIHECEHISDELDYEHMNGNMAYSTYSDFKDSISKIQKWLEENRWIPVSERLPEKDKSVFVFTDCGETDFAYIGYRTGHWFTNGMLLIPTVTHWMPLPEPPQGV